jgi:hypothetical protein
MSKKKTETATTENAVENPTAVTAENVINTEVTPTVEATIDNTNEAEDKKTPGRPIDENSARQQRLVDREVKRLLAGGELKRGRPVNNTSERQKRLSSKDPNAKPGRPAMSEEQKAANAEARKKQQDEHKAKMIAATKEKLMNAGLLNEDGTPKEGVTAEQIRSVLIPATVEA